MTQSKRNILFYMVSTLVALMLISLFLLSGIYAKYTITASSDDSARVAKFDVGTNGGIFSASYALELDPETSETVDDALILVNSSEVAVKCKLKMESLAELPLTFTWKSGSDEYTAKIDEDAIIEFAPLSEKNFELTVAWDNSDESNKSFIYRRQVDKLVLNVECVQID